MAILINSLQAIKEIKGPGSDTHMYYVGSDITK